MLAGALADVRDKERGNLFQAVGAVFRQAHNHALNAKRKAEAFRGRAAEHLRESVITAAADNCVLGAELAPCNLERRASVIVESAHESGRNRVLDATFVEEACELFEVQAAGVAKRIGD